MGMKLFIFANEKRVDWNILNILTEDFPKAELLITENFDMIRNKINPSFDALVCAGGDGTLNSFLNIAIKEGLQDKVYGIIPIGSGNDFSKYALGFNNIKESIDSIVSYANGNDNAKRFDIGYIAPKEKIYFHNVAGLGFDAKTVEEAATL